MTPPRDTFDREAVLLLGRMDGKLDAVIAQTGELGGTLKDHATRLGALERWRAYIIGISTAAGASAGLVVEKLTALLFR